MEMKMAHDRYAEERWAMLSVRNAFFLAIGQFITIVLDVSRALLLIDRLSDFIADDSELNGYLHL